MCVFLLGKGMCALSCWTPPFLFAQGVPRPSYAPPPSTLGAPLPVAPLDRRPAGRADCDCRGGRLGQELPTGGAGGGDGATGGQVGGEGRVGAQGQVGGEGKGGAQGQVVGGGEGRGLKGWWGGGGGGLLGWLPCPLRSALPRRAAALQPRARLPYPPLAISTPPASPPRCESEPGARIGYVPQTPWMMSGNLRDNVLMGQPMDLQHYQQVRGGGRGAVLLWDPPPHLLYCPPHTLYTGSGTQGPHIT